MHPFFFFFWSPLGRGSLWLCYTIDPWGVIPTLEPLASKALPLSSLSWPSVPKTWEGGATGVRDTCSTTWADWNSFLFAEIECGNNYSLQKPCPFHLIKANWAFSCSVTLGRGQGPEQWSVKPSSSAPSLHWLCTGREGLGRGLAKEALSQSERIRHLPHHSLWGSLTASFVRSMARCMPYYSVWTMTKNSSDKWKHFPEAQGE